MEALRLQKRFLSASIVFAEVSVFISTTSGHFEFEGNWWANLNFLALHADMTWLDSLYLNLTPATIQNFLQELSYEMLLDDPDAILQEPAL